MCFSMTASLTAGAALTVAGAVTVGSTRRRAELPLALIPLLFGLQQLTEGVVWWSLDHDNATVNIVSTVVYLLFAHVLWPLLVPFAVLSLEVVPSRRKVLSGFLALGGVVALVGLDPVVLGPHTSHVNGSSIGYDEPSLWVIGLYLVATCGAALLSSHRLLQLMGASALGLGLVVLWLYLAVFVSLWCFFCAVLTIIICLYFWAVRRSPRPAGS
jgi:hypothetical protein